MSKKLTREQVVYIRSNPDKLSKNELIEKMHVSSCCIYRIRNYISYKDIGIVDKIGPYCNCLKKISDEDVAFIEDNYGRLSGAEIAKILNINKEAVYYHFKKIKNKQKNKKVAKKLTEEDVLSIIENTDKLSIDELARIYKVSVGTIREIQHRRTWRYIDQDSKISFSSLSKKDKDYIKNNPDNLLGTEIAEKLKMNVSTVYRNGYVANKKKKKDTLYIQDNPDGLSASELAKKLNISVNAVYNSGYATKPHKIYHKLTDEEVQFIQDNSNKLSAKELAEKFNVSLVTIYNNGYEPRHKLTDEEVQFIQNNPDKLSVKELAEKLNVSLATIYNKIKSINKQ